jgi:hypothetical protein
VVLHLIDVVLFIFKRSDNILLLYDTGDELENILLQYKAFYPLYLGTIRMRNVSEATTEIVPFFKIIDK